jgi:hypothetical protein
MDDWSPLPELTPGEGPICHPVLLMMVGSMAGAIGADVFWRLVIDVFHGGISDMVFIGGIGFFVGMWGGMIGGIVTGQVARVSFRQRERRYYQLAGAFVTGALVGVASIFVCLWCFFRVSGD